MLSHGGELGAASRRYGIPESEWLDLSTGIAPWSWPVPPVPERVWARLPEAGDGLLEAAAGYYGCGPALLTAVPGSQFGIRWLPRTVPAGTVAVPAVGYAEHARCWREAGHRLAHYEDAEGLRTLLPRVDHAVVVNPNNPTGETLTSEALLALRERLPADGLLVVDEAFADVAGDSLVPRLPVPGVAVLRSLGKFFGLAGLRLGFVAGEGTAIERLRAEVAPWGVSHPARWIGARALADGGWQHAQRARIAAGGDDLAACLGRHCPGRPVANAGLFATVRFDDDTTAGACHEALACRGMLARLGDDGRWLRFGLPPEGAGQLEPTLCEMTEALS